jgi:hypothetical protein
MLAPAPSSANPAASLSILGAIIAVFRRKLPIGGWLFFFLWGAFAGCGITVLEELSGRLDLLPGKWKDQTRYLFHLLSLGPRVFSLFLVAAVSIVLIRHREWRWIQLLRAALAAYVICQLATVLIDAFVFPGSVAIAVAGLFNPIAFLLYTLFSARVAGVFQKHDWEVRNIQPSESSPASTV